MRMHTVLWDPAGGEGAGGAGGAAGGEGAAGGGAAPWYSSLPEDLGKDPSIIKFKDVPELAKGYVNAQRLIGTKRLEAPQSTWTDKEWSALYDAIGRPPSPDKYSPPDGVKFAEGVQFDTAKLNGVKAKFHELGLTEKQGREVLGLYMNSVNGAVEAEQTSRKQAQEKAMADLRGEFGDQLDAKIGLGRQAIEKLGGDKLKEWLNTSGVGNQPELVRAMIKLGELLQGDNSSGGTQGGHFTAEQETARAEIANLRGNKEFLMQLTTQHDPGHRAAVGRWETLHAKAYPGKQQE